MIKVELIKQKRKGETNTEVMLKVTTDESIMVDVTEKYFTDVAIDMKESLEKAETIMDIINKLSKGGDTDEKHN